MTIDINKKYQETLTLLKEGKRPFIKLSDLELIELSNQWIKLNQSQAPQENYFPILCLADHLVRSHKSLNAPLIYTLENRKETNLLVYTLTASFKVVIEESIRKSERIPFNFLNALKVPLSHGDWEVLEWTLRVIDQLGQQSILLKKETLEQRPKFIHRLNPKLKNIFGLINMLEKRWSPNE